MNIYCKIDKKNYKIQELAQVAPKNISTCILNPYNSDNLNDIHHTLMNSNLGF